MSTSATSTEPDAISAPAPTPPHLHAPHRVGGPRRWWDWIIAADPGLGHLQAGWRALVAMVTGLAVGYGMSRALDLPAMLGMMAGGMMGLMSSFAIAENTAFRLARAMLLMPFPFGAVLVLGAWLHDDRTLLMVLIGAALTLTFVLARWGPLGLLTGMMLFNGMMVTMMAPIPLAQCGQMFVATFVSVLAILAARLLLCYPMPREDLLRTQRAFVVEARRVVDAAATALDPDADQDVAIKRMRRALRRLNVTTLTIDGRLAMPETAADPAVAELLHQYLFDAELALSGIGSAVQEMAGRQVPPELRESMVIGLTITRDTHLGRTGALHPVAEMIRRQADETPGGMGEEEAETRALTRRVAGLLDGLADSLAYWLDIGWKMPKSGVKVPFQPTVALERGVPASSGPATRKLIGRKGGDGWRRAVPVVRAPLQVAIGAAVVIPVADAVSGRRFYWGLIGMMIVLFGTNTTHERLRKFAHRVVGTVAGAVIGIAVAHLLAHVTGQAHVYWMLAVMVAGVSVGAWGMQRQYAYWVTGLVVALCQMYATETPMDGMNRLLTQRLLENSLGFTVGILVAMLIFPISTGKVAREVERGYLDAVGELVSQIAQRWKDPQAPIRLRGAARAVDAALYQIRSVARPLVRMPMGVRGRENDNLLALFGAATRHAGVLATAADVDLDLAPHLRERVERITDVFAGSLRALDQAVGCGDRDGAWTRVSPMIRDLEQAVRNGADGEPAPHTKGRGPAAALRELAALDEVLAGLASHRGLAVTTVTLETANPIGPLARTGPPEPLDAAAAATPPSGSGAPATTPPSPAASAAAPAAVPPGRSGDAPSPAAAEPDGPSTGELRALRAAWARSGGVTDTAANAALGVPVRRGRHAAPTPPDQGRPETRAARHRGDPADGASVYGAVRCPEHPSGCDAWITVVNERGKRRAGVRAAAGDYRITGLPPGTYTLIVSGAGHAPGAASVAVSEADMRRDIRLDASS